MYPLLQIDQYAEVNSSIKKIWESYFSSGQPHPGLREVVKNSWDRCRETDLPTSLARAPRQLTSQTLRITREKNAFLLSIAKPIFNALCSQFNTQGLVMVLTDNEGTILQEETTMETIRIFDKLNFSTGATWSEDYCGTNAIGTALTTQSPVTIFSAEHYCEGWHHLVCTASPVTDPFTHATLGIIDLTGKKELLGAHNFTLVQAAKSMIEHAIEQEYTRNGPTPSYQALAEEKQPTVVFTLNGKITRSNRMAHIVFHVKEGMSFRHKFRLPESSEMGRNVKVTLQYSEDEKDWEISITPHIIDNRMMGGIAVFRPISQKNPTAAAREKQTPVADSTSFRELLRSAVHAASFDFPLLITGSTGVGKERLAHYIYEQSPRHQQPFVPVNCGAIPRDLIAGELFGYMPGAFTGADPKGKKGKFVHADKGILFLDEIAELPLEMQPYLLRILEEKIVYPLGAEKGWPIDVRIIAATHKNLEAEVAAGRFREDLYYRLNVINLHIDDLKDRPEDILLLFRFFMDAHLAHHVFINPETQQKLLSYPWPGNVREVKNAAEHVVYMLNHDLEVNNNHLPEKIAHFLEIHSSGKPDSKARFSPSLSGKELGILIRSVLEQEGGNMSKAAKMLNVSRMTLYRKMKLVGQD